MATTIKLYYTDRNSTYKEWELLPNKLLIVEDIAAYLNTKSAYTLTNFQYIKNDLEIGINVDLSQSYAQPKAATSFKYVSIQNSDELIHYYFVKKVVWRSKSAVRFELVMDVLNTFQEGSDYEFKANTRIVREHKDRIFRASFTLYLKTSASSFTGNIDEDDNIYLRSTLDGNNIFSGVFKGYSGTSKLIQFKAPITLLEIKNWLASLTSTFYIYKDSSNYIQMTGNPSIDNITDNVFMRKIDYVSEGINPILFHTAESGFKIENQKTLLRQNWYLLYRNQSEPDESLVNPVECYLIPEDETPVDSGVITSGKLTASSLVSDKAYFFRLGEEDSFGQTRITQGITLPNGDSYSGRGAHYGVYGVLTRNSANKMDLVILNYDTNYLIQAIYNDLDYIQLDTMPFKYVRENSVRYNNFYLNSMWDNEDEWTNTDASNKLFPVSQLDKTDAKNIKLIKLPYCPYNFTITGGKIVVSSEPKWEYTYFTQANNIDFYVLKLKNLNTKLNSNIEMSANISPYNNLFITLSSPSIANLRKPFSLTPANNLESKLLHSDFYQDTYFYDSFSIKIDLEKCKLSYYESGLEEKLKQKITFDMTSTINSKFMFTFTNYVCDKSDINFYNVLPIARNNEEVLYNVPYINYIRTGFNYDVKSKNIQNTANYIGLGLSAASVGASLLAPSVPLKVAGVVASLVSMAMSVKNTIVTTINNENSIKQKIQQTQNQASSVAGSDDVDLMTSYSGNRLQNYTYRPTELMQNLLNDLFFYAGYSSNRMGIPNHHTRVNFDYLECEAQIEAAASIPDECMTELINCFKSGVTYLHKTDRYTYKWDFEQDFENWELELID